MAGIHNPWVAPIRRRHLCRDCARLGSEESTYRQAVRDIGRCLCDDGRIRRRQRKTFEQQQRRVRHRGRDALDGKTVDDHVPAPPDQGWLRQALRDRFAARRDDPAEVGGTHACQIHRESSQLIIGPYFIDAKGNVRAADVTKLVGRMTAVMRHLTDPANKAYFFDMEGARSTKSTSTAGGSEAVRQARARLAWQGRLRFPVARSHRQQRRAGKHQTAGLKYLVGEEPKSLEEAGVLAEWDSTWRIVER